MIVPDEGMRIKPNGYIHERMYVMMRKMLSLLLALLLCVNCTVSLAEASKTNPAPPAMPGDGSAPADMGRPPEGGAPSDKGQPPESGAPSNKGQPPKGGAPGGQSSQPESYAAVIEVSEDTTLTGSAYDSIGTDENAILVQSGKLTLTDSKITRASSDSTGGDTSSFYGVGAAVLAAGGTADISDVTVTTDASGAAGVFSYGDAVVYVSDSVIATRQNTSGGIHVAGGGTLYAKDLTVTTEGESSAAIRSDRGGGTMVVDGGSYMAAGVGSPAVYVTADITISGATLASTGSEALCLEGLNTVRLYDCDLTGTMKDLDQNDNTWTVILYQSMSGDAEIGEGRFEMVGGTLTAKNGGLFYTTNTESEFVLSGVTLVANEDCEYLLRCTGNLNQRGWGAAGANGASCVFTAIDQQMTGDVLWDTISTLDLFVTRGSTLTGAVLNDESCAGEGGEGSAVMRLDSSSTWVVTADSLLTSLESEGAIMDEQGNAVTILDADGTVYVQGNSALTVTVSNYAPTCDLSDAGTVESYADYAVEF